MSSPHLGGAPSLAVLMLVVGGFCAHHYPGEQPEELRLKFKSGRRLKVPVSTPAPARREDAHPGDDSADHVPLPADTPAHPLGCIRQPVCAIVVLATLLANPDTPLEAKDVEAKLQDNPDLKEFGLSSIEKTLSDLCKLKLVVSHRGRGYALTKGWQPGG